MENYLVLGAGGFIGGELFECLSLSNPLFTTDWVNVYGISRKVAYNGWVLSNVDLTHGDEVEGLFKKVKPTLIYHLAAVQNSDPHCFETNVLSTRNIIRHAPEGVPIVFTSSSTVYGNLAEKLGRSCKETDAMAPTSPYGFSKARCEELLLENKKNPATILRLGATIGANANKGLIPAIVKKLRDPATETLSLIGDVPGSSKPYTYVDDVVRGIIDLSLTPGICNLSVEGHMNVSDIADLTMSELGILKRKVWTSQTDVGDNRLVAMDGSRRLSYWIHLDNNDSKMAILKTLGEIKRGN